MIRHRKDLCGAPKTRGHRPWPMRKSVTGYPISTKRVGKLKRNNSRIALKRHGAGEKASS